MSISICKPRCGAVTVQSLWKFRTSDIAIKRYRDIPQHKTRIKRGKNKHQKSHPIQHAPPKKTPEGPLGREHIKYLLSTFFSTRPRPSGILWRERDITLESVGWRWNFDEAETVTCPPHKNLKTSSKTRWANDPGEHPTWRQICSAKLRHVCSKQPAVKSE